MVTPRRVTITITCVSVVVMSSVGLVYSTSRLGLKYFPGRNTTLLGIVFTGNREVVDKVTVAINNVMVPFGAFLIIIICTVTLAFELHKKTRWRKVTTQFSRDDAVTARNLNAGRMVIMISTLFIVCFTPLNVGFVAMALIPELSLEGKHKNKLVVLGGLGVILESVNSSGNIFIYYHMSSKYRSIFRQIFVSRLGGSSRCRGDLKH